MTDEKQNSGVAKSNSFPGQQTPLLGRVLICGILALLTAWILLPHAAWAGPSDQVFNEAAKSIAEFFDGAVGKALAITMICVGTVVGIVRLSFASFAAGIVSSLIICNMGTILQTATGSSIKEPTPTDPSIWIFVLVGTAILIVAGVVIGIKMKLDEDARAYRLAAMRNDTPSLATLREQGPPEGIPAPVEIKPVTQVATATAAEASVEVPPEPVNVYPKGHRKIVLD